MSGKHILIVDDDKFILTFLEHTLKKFAPDYKITTVLNGPEALEQLQITTFDLVITDYLMPGISGVDLANAVRHMMPETAIVLMTAYATDQLNHTIELMHVDGYIRKPLNLSQIRNVIRKIVGDINTKPTAKSLDTNELNREIYQNLEKLYNNIGARFVVLVNAGGYAVQYVGPVEQDEVDQTVLLVAANFQTAQKLTTMVDNHPHYKSSTFSGDNYHTYAYNIDDVFLLAVAFSHDTRPGIVWIYTKQTSEALTSLVRQLPVNKLMPQLQLDLNFKRLQAPNGSTSNH